MGVYQLPAATKQLLQLSLTPSNLLDSLLVILLDWDRPWTFLPQLQTWLALIQATLQDMPPLNAAKDRLEAFIKAYQEPVLKEDGTIGTTPQPARDAAELDLLPLPSGTLSVNLGLPIVVVCTKVCPLSPGHSSAHCFGKSDVIDSLEKERLVTEEQIDYIQQTLRTVCLHCKPLWLLFAQLMLVQTALHSSSLRNSIQRASTD
jgi:dynein light intermediate chain 1